MRNLHKRHCMSYWQTRLVFLAILAAIAAAPAISLAQTDEIQVYDAEIEEWANST